MTLRRAISGATAAVLVLLSAVTTGGVAAADPATATITAVVDPATHHEYPGTDEAETYFVSTGHAGRVWTDKTVFKDAITIPQGGDGEPTPLDDDELAVALSALGSTRHITSEIPTPIDVVLILDVSGSMRYCIGTSSTNCTSDEDETNPYTNSRAQAMVEAVNTALKIIENDNPNNRVALSYFSDTVGVMQTLGAPKRVSETEYVSLQRDGSNLYLQYRNDQNTVTSRQITGGTNTQLGIATGMNLLANQVRSTVTGVNQHLPNVVLLTDGVPTYSSSSSSWWSPAANSGNGNGSTAYYGNGFKAAMTASYLKNKIADIYGNMSNPVDFDPKVYTVGLGVSQMTANDGNLSKITLDPATYYGKPGNTFFSGFNTAFGAYASGGSTSVTVNNVDNPTTANPNNYTVAHPPQVNEAPDPYDVTDLRYNDAFYAPATEDDMIKVFTEIARQITAPVANPPVQTETGSESASGYVTFTDPLGAFMEVAAMDRITFCSLAEGASDPEACAAKAFTNPAKETSSDGLTDTYTFAGKYPANDIYGESDVSKMIITVKRSENPAIGDVVTVKIPSALLPMRDSYITEKEDGTPVEMSVEVSHPVHIYYVVSPKQVTAESTVLDYLSDPVALNKARPGWGTALAQYVRDNADDGKVRFNANDYRVDAATEAKVAEAKVTFLPAAGNLFYRFGVNTILYLNAFEEDGVLTRVDPTSTITKAEWDALDSKTPIFYEYGSYWLTGETKTSVELRNVVLGTSKDLLELPHKNDGIELGWDESTDFMYAPVQMRDYARAANMDLTKCEEISWSADGVPTCGDSAAANETETDPSVRRTTYDSQTVVVNLGNNGYLETPATGRISISKDVARANGTSPSPDTRFTFKLDVTAAADGQVLPNTFPVEVFEDTGHMPIDGFYVGNGETFQLKANQVAHVYGLPHGSTYRVEEVNIPKGYTPSYDGATTGKIDAGAEVPEIAVTNTYVPEAVTEAGPNVTKAMPGDEWRGGELFEALLWSSTSGSVVDRVQMTAESPNASFKAIKFSEPGTYAYTITEFDGYKTYPAVSFSPASYQWIVTVSDDGKGSLTAESSMTRTIPDPGLPEIGPVESKVATFTNRFDPDSVYGALQAVKVIDDRTLGDSEPRAPELSHTFEFWYAGVDLIDGDTAAGAPDLEDVSLPHFGADDVVRVTNAAQSSDVASPELTFGRAHVGHVYYYGVKEVENESLDFVEHDKSVFFYRIVVVARGGGVEVDVTHCKTTKDAVAEEPLLGTCAVSFADDPTADEDVVFTNTYDAGPASADLKVTKVLQDRPWNGDAFEFVLEPVDVVTIQAVADEAIIMPTSAQATAAGVGNVTFSGITFKQQGNYQFRVREVLPDGAVNGAHHGIAYDTHAAVYDVVVTNPGVTGEASDRLVAQVTLRGQEGEDRSTFTNVYSANPVTATPMFVKTFLGRNEWLPADEFTFTFALAAVTDDAPLPSTTSITVGSADEGEGFAFGAIRFESPGTYRYTVTEQVPENPVPGVRYDTSAVTFDVVVADNGLGELQTSIEYDGDDREFINEYVPTTWDLVKSSDRDATVSPGDEITYTITATNTSKEGAAPLTNVVITDDLSGVLGADDNPKAHWVGFVGDGGKYASIEGSTLTWKLESLSGTRTLSYTVVVDKDAHDVTLRNAVTGMGGVDPDGDGGGDVPPESCVAGTPVADLDDDCITVHVTGPAWTIAKSSPTATEVKPGDTIDYVVDVTFLGNEGSVIPGVVVVDSLSDVLEHATFDMESIDPSVGEAELVDGTLRWTIGNLTKNARLTYSVTVSNDAHGVDLVNLVTGTGGTGEDGDDEGETPPIACATGEDPECTTVHTTDPAWTIAKSSPTATEVKPGDTIEYVVDVTLLGDEGRSIPSVVVIDDLSDVLEHATLNMNSIDPSVGDAELLDDGTLRWDIGNLTEDATLRYSVTVDPDAKAYGATLHNLVWGTSTGADVDGDGEPDVVPPAQCTEMSPCSTDHEVATPTWTIKKSSDSVAVPGGSLTYQLTVTNTGDIPLWGATISDGPMAHGKGVTDIWAFLDDGGWDGKYTVRIGDDGEDKPDEDTNPADGLQHTITELGVGEHAVVTFTVKLPDQLDGVHLRNTVVGQLIPDPAGPGEEPNPSFPPAACAIPNGEEPCSVDHTYPPGGAWTLDKTAAPPSGTSSLQPGETVTYTLTVTNAAENDVTDIVVTDDLAQVLADDVVTLNDFDQPEVGTVGELTEDDTLVWTIDKLAPGQTAEFTYSVTVVESATAYGTTLHNEAWGTGRGVTEDGPDEVLPPGQCTEAEPCSTDHEVPVPAWTLAKSSDTDKAAPGGDITYELLVTNTGDVPLYGAQVVDGPRKQADGVTDIWSVLAGDGWKGEYTVRIGEGDPVAHTDDDPSDGLQAVLDTVPAGSTATVTFTVTLPSNLDTVHLRNTVTGALPGDPDGPVYPPNGCSEPGPDDACSADHEYVAPSTNTPPPAVTAPKVSSGGSLVATGSKLAALAAAAALLVTAAALLVRRRREEPTG